MDKVPAHRQGHSVAVQERSANAPGVLQGEDGRSDQRHELSV